MSQGDRECFAKKGALQGGFAENQRSMFLYEIE